MAADPFIPAPFMRRIMSLVYDALLMLALWFMTTLSLILLTKPWTGQDSIQGAHRIYLYLLLFVVTLVFFSAFWRHNGQTLGMQAWRIRVDSVDGRALSWRQSLLRFLLAWGTLGIGLLWALFDPRKKALYDRLSGTHLIWLIPGLPHRRD